LTVCGALPPYNDMLGGKLVAMLAASPATVTEYRRRYANASSVIASSMAGRAVRRAAELVLVGTTSLYGVRPSQYDRIAVPCEKLGGRESDMLRYVFLEHTQGVGTFQFSATTLAALKGSLRQSRNGLTVNSVFGEGASPRMRLIRDALAQLSLPEEELLRHAQGRLVYVVPLVRNLRRYLLGMENQPDYLFPLDNTIVATRAIGDWWLERWVAPRLDNVMLDRISKHSLSLPIRHGARVVLPDIDLDEPELF
jgi:hypothetical protein